MVRNALSQYAALSQQATRIELQTVVVVVAVFAIALVVVEVLFAGLFAIAIVVAPGLGTAQAAVFVFVNFAGPVTALVVFCPRPCSADCLKPPLLVSLVRVAVGTL